MQGTLKEVGSNARIYNQLGNHSLVFNSVAIVDTEEGKDVFFIAPIHINKVSKVSFSYNNTWNDIDILNDRDLMTQFINRYGVDGLKNAYCPHK